MTIEKGRNWGSPAEHGAEPPTAADDAELASMAAAGRAAGAPLTAVVAAGDVLTTIGLDHQRAPGERFAFSLDLGLAHLGEPSDGPGELPVPFVAHVLAGPVPRIPATGPLLARVGSGLGLGPTIDLAIMNAQWVGELRLGPRAHPNDGVLDVIEGRVGLMERREANRRARSGSHLPHPALRCRRVAALEQHWERDRAIRIDGVDRGRFRSIRVELVPDALTVIA